MTTFERILKAITKFNDDCDGQANLNSPHARMDLATFVYDVVMKQEDPGTFNDEQLELFSNKDD